MCPCQLVVTVLSVPSCRWLVPPPGHSLSQLIPRMLVYTAAPHRALTYTAGPRTVPGPSTCSIFCARNCQHSYACPHGHPAAAWSSTTDDSGNRCSCPVKAQHNSTGRTTHGRIHGCIGALPHEISASRAHVTVYASPNLIDRAHAPCDLAN